MTRTTDRVGTKTRLMPNGKMFGSWKGRPYGRALKRAKLKRRG